MDGLQASLQQLQGEGKSLTTEGNTNKVQIRSISGKIHRKLGDKRKLSLKLMELRNAREEEEEPQENIATYVSRV